ncbi:MAG: ATP-binding cassette domain-containing protein [Desulfovibrio sp.]|nr:MAG: ATP-binding cassette domain-containing protein [Desulfovibrio sp.]
MEEPQLRLILAAHRGEDLPVNVNHLACFDQGRLVWQGPWRKDLPLPSAAAQHNQAPAQLSRPALPPAPDEPPSPLFVIRNTDVYVEGTPALGNLDWTLEPGANWAVLGPNGSGKTSFLRLLYGELHPALGGHIQRLGVDQPGTASPSKKTLTGPIQSVRKRMGWVSPTLQATMLAREGLPITIEECVLSGLDNHLGLHVTPTPEVAASARELMVGLCPDLSPERTIEELSYGQFRRVLLTRALLGEPWVLLLDEPCSGLDTQARSIFLDSLDRVAEQGTALVMTTHRSDELPRAVTHHLLLDQGRVAYMGPRHDSSL